MTGTELRWGILSTADIGRKKVIPGMQKALRSRVVALASRDGERAAQVCAELGIERSHASYEALLADPDVDAVYIPLPNDMHPEWAIAAARAGKHVLCEKPLAMSSRAAEEMVSVADGAGVTLMEAFMYRLHPSWLAVREIVESGRIGRLESVQSWFGYYNDDYSNIRNIRAAGGGAMYDIGCYLVNLSRMLFGGEPTRVQSSVRRDPASGVDTLASAILDFEGGIASLTCSTRTETDQRVHVYGTQGRVSVGIPFNIPSDRPTEIYVTAGGDPPLSPDVDVLRFDTKDPYTAEAEAFEAVVLDGAEPPLPARDAVANVRVIERIFEAAEA